MNSTAHKKSLNKIPSTPNERLEYIRNLLNLSRPDIARKYGLSQETLRACEKNRNTLTEKTLNKLIEIYRHEGLIVSKEWILTGGGFDPKIHKDISKYFSEIEKSNLSKQENDDEFLMIKEAEFFKNLAANSIILSVTTNEMMPFYSPGDYVGGRLMKKEDIPKAIGKDCIAVLHDGSKFFRRLVRNSTGDGFNLVCINPSWGSTLEPVLYDVDIESIAPVIWHRRLNN